MIKFKRHPHRVGETYGMDGGLTKRQVTMAINKPVRQAKKLQAKAPLLAELLTAEPVKDFDAEAEYKRRQAAFDYSTQKTRDFHARTWRKARQRFFELDSATQQAIIKEWNWLTRCHMPAESTRFAGVVDRISGDRDKRLARYEAEHNERMRQIRERQNKQIDMFGDGA